MNPLYSLRNRFDLMHCLLCLLFCVYAACAVCVVVCGLTDSYADSGTAKTEGESANACIEATHIVHTIVAISAGPVAFPISHLEHIIIFYIILIFI